MPVLTPYGNKSIAFTVLKPSSGTPLPSRTLNFAASELSFHTLDGSKFTVTYTVNAAVKSQIMSNLFDLQDIVKSATIMCAHVKSAIISLFMKLMFSSDEIYIVFM